ncbi:MAG TPA: FAD-dependent oxidoreductase [Candidatus Binatia bacterium]|nr:FAD-dependent oxidoreductase [Candidatus Binatia bacterium]
MTPPTETTLEPDDPSLRPAQTFPRLSPDMVARVASYGAEEDVPEGALLFARGQRSIDFFVILSGRIDVFDLDEEGAPRVFVSESERQFTGEVDQITDRQILVSGRAAIPTRVIRVPHKDFRRMLAAESDVAEILMRAFILRRVSLINQRHGGVVIVGPAHGGDTLRLQRFLDRNGHPYRVVDTDADPEGDGYFGCVKVREAKMPVVVWGGEHVLGNPTTAQLADALGLTWEIDVSHVYDIAVVGAGPAGLAAGVYASSEGLDTIIVEGMAPGGQAGTSSKIENYLGFPTGITGRALAGRAQVQAQKFGARIAISRPVTRMDCGDDRIFRLTLDEEKVIAARAVVIATGARYRTLALPNFDRFEGQGIQYAATAMEAALCTNQEVVVVGGGNSAGQAAVYLSRKSNHVHMIVRARGLASTMSAYLVRRIESSPLITLHTETELTALEGETRLQRVTWTNRATNVNETRDIENVFLMIGAVPNTDWVSGCLRLDAKGFVLTGADVDAAAAIASPYATSKPGIWAVGDVRAGSVKRVAAGVGEGSVVVQAIHQYLSPDVV